jgi:hypothetical protein
LNFFFRVIQAMREMTLHDMSFRPKSSFWSMLPRHALLKPYEFWEQTKERQKHKYPLTEPCTIMPPNIRENPLRPISIHRTRSMFSLKVFLNRTCLSSL